MLELLDYMVGGTRGSQGNVRAPPRAGAVDVVGLLQAAVNVAIVWFGGYMNVTGGASIGDIMAFQWYTFC